MSDRLLREYIAEVLAGFGNKSFGRDGVSGNLFPTGIGTGDAGVRPTAHASTDDEEDSDEERADQDAPQAACCLVLSDDGHVLAVSRKDDPSQFGMPGGHVDPGESPEEAAARELTEETGLFATKLSLVFRKRDGEGFVTSTYACEVEGDINTDESGVIKWVKPSVLTNPASSPFVDYNVELFKKLGLSE